MAAVAGAATREKNKIGRDSKPPGFEGGCWKGSERVQPQGQANAIAVTQVRVRREENRKKKPWANTG